MKKEKIMKMLAKVGAILLTLLYFDNVYLQIKYLESLTASANIVFNFVITLILQFIPYGVPAIPLYYYGFKKSQ